MPTKNPGWLHSSPFIFGIVLVHLFGCGPSQEVLDHQDAQLKEAIREAKIDPPNITAEEKEMRRHRLEMDFGEAAPKSK